MITTYHISNAPIHEVKTWIRNNAHGKHAENYKNIEFEFSISFIHYSSLYQR